MAIYVGNRGEVDAVQLAEPTPFSNGYVGQPGEWLVNDIDGQRRLYIDKAFTSEFRQKFPRMDGVELPAAPQPDGPRAAS